VPDETPIPEDAPLRPVNPYGESKRSLEAAMAWYGRAYGMRSVSLRYFNVAGATDDIGEDHDPETHLIPAILRSVEAGRTVTIFGGDYPTRDGTNVRDYIHVADLADAHLRAIEATGATGATAGDGGGGEGFLVCNLGNGDGFTNLEVLRAAEAIVGRAIPHRIGPRRPGDPPTLVASAIRAADVLDWRPQRPRLEEMVRSAWAWRQAHPGGYAD
jgi:UDP-glucose 4-epimerase